MTDSQRKGLRRKANMMCAALAVIGITDFIIQQLSGGQVKLIGTILGMFFEGGR